MMSPNFRFFRPGAGIRLWINRQTEFPLYLDAQLNYYLISGSDFEMRSSPASISGTLGTGYNFAQGIGLRAGLVVESSIQNGRTRFNRVERDFSLSSIGLGFGLQYDF